MMTPACRKADFQRTIPAAKAHGALFVQANSARSPAYSRMTITRASHGLPAGAMKAHRIGSDEGVVLS